MERAEESPLRGFLTLCFTHNTLALAPRPQYTIYTVLGSAIVRLPLSSLSLALRRSHQNRLREVAIDGGRSRVSLQVLPINQALDALLDVGRLERELQLRIQL